MVVVMPGGGGLDLLSITWSTGEVTWSSDQKLKQSLIPIAVPQSGTAIGIPSWIALEMNPSACGISQYSG